MPFFARMKPSLQKQSFLHKKSATIQLSLNSSPQMSSQCFTPHPNVSVVSQTFSVSVNKLNKKSKRHLKFILILTWTF